jgi:hypothetical protein
MATKEEQKQQATDAILQAGQAYLQTDEGMKFFQKIQNAKGQVDDSRAVAGAVDTKQLKQQIKDLNIKLVAYRTKGKIYDKTTGEPLKGVEIKPVGILYPVEPYIKVKKIKVDDPSGDKNIFGKIKKVKKEVEEIRWRKADFDDEGREAVFTNAEGEYNMQFAVPVIEGFDVTPLRGEVLVLPDPKASTSRGNSYAPNYIQLITGNGEVKEIQSPLAMVDLVIEGEKQAIALANEAVELGNKAIAKFLSPVEQTLLALKARIQNLTKIVQTRLFPLAIQLLILFGITKTIKSDIEETKCPSDEALKECIKKRNSIVRQINQVYVIIAQNTILAAIFLILTQQVAVIKNAISNIALPLGAPLGVGVPYSVVAAFENIKEIITLLGNVNKDLRKGLLISLIFLVICLIIILRYLKKLDALIERCSNGKIDMTEINAELLALQNEEESQGNPQLTNVNGFSMSVEPVKDSQVGDLYRRQAIAKNSQGVVLLRGEGSFSATDQVLLDELAFYIVQNDLKAD